VEDVAKAVVYIVMGLLVVLWMFVGDAR